MLVRTRSKHLLCAGEGQYQCKCAVMARVRAVQVHVQHIKTHFSHTSTCTCDKKPSNHAALHLADNNSHVCLSGHDPNMYSALRRDNTYSNARKQFVHKPYKYMYSVQRQKLHVQVHVRMTRSDSATLHYILLITTDTYACNDTT